MLWNSFDHSVSLAVPNALVGTSCTKGVIVYINFSSFNESPLTCIPVNGVVKQNKDISFTPRSFVLLSLQHLPVAQVRVCGVGGDCGEQGKGSRQGARQAFALVSTVKNRAQLL